MNQPTKASTWKAAAFWSLLAAVSFHSAYAWPRSSALLVVYVFSLIQLARAESWRKAAYSGLGAGFFIAAGRLDFFWKVFGTGAFALWMVYAFWIALFVALARLSLGRESLRAPNPHKSFLMHPKWDFVGWMLLPFIWTGLEYFRSELYYLRFSWLSPGYGFVPGQLPFGFLGVYGVGFLIATLATSASALWSRSRIQSLVAVLVIVLGVSTAGRVFKSSVLPDNPGLLLHSNEAQSSVQLAGIQMEFPSENEVLFRLSDLVRKYPQTELVVLSEYTFAEELPPTIQDWCRENHRYLIIGAEDPSPGNYYDTAFVIAPSGKIVFKQAKAVPIQFMKDGLAARKQELWDSPWGKIGICVCYDLSYSRVTDELIKLGAQALVVPTMDVLDWGERQHRLHARVAPVRAAEYGIPIFRIASSGISQWVDKRGQTLAEAPCPGDDAIISGTLQVNSRGSLPLDRWLAPCCTVITTVIILWFAVSGRLIKGPRSPATMSRETPQEPEHERV